MTNSTRAYLTTFSLTMITVGSVDSIRNLPATALFGSHLIFFFIVAAIFFLIPCALVSAELSASWPEHGGIYGWLKEAFGTRLGFVGIWFQWIENVIWYPTILSFVAGTLGYLINPELIHNRAFLIVTILSCFWGATFINLRGIESSARFSSLCSIAGLLLPMTLIIGLGSLWLLGGHTNQISFHVHDILPDMQQSNIWVALTGIMMSFCGVEIATVHAADVADPQRSFPRALFYSVLIILLTLMFGSLAIAVVLPVGSISLVAGIMQAFDAFFAAYQLHWCLPFIAVMLVLGGLGGVSNWIIAPTKGLLIAARDGNLPPIMRNTNEHGAPRYLLIAQALIVSVLSLVFLLMPTVNGSYWLLTALAAQVYMLMYMMMFIAAIVLRLRYPVRQTLFRIPGGIAGLITVCALGLMGCLVTFCVGFMPPTDIAMDSVLHYETLLLGGLIFMCLPPFLLTKSRQLVWKAAVER